MAYTVWRVSFESTPNFNKLNSFAKLFSRGKKSFTLFGSGNFPVLGT